MCLKTYPLIFCLIDRVQGTQTQPLWHSHRLKHTKEIICIAFIKSLSLILHESLSHASFQLLLFNLSNCCFPEVPAETCPWMEKRPEMY